MGNMFAVGLVALVCGVVVCASAQQVDVAFAGGSLFSSGTYE
ncbi:MAG TPA: hypothetical protein VMP68_19380 [Candidatus Eisenbacteria bacterium]|nr:hypothetical protein [Candidatus Eisenbacteria bacterium]